MNVCKQLRSQVFSLMVLILHCLRWYTSRNLWSGCREESADILDNGRVTPQDPFSRQVLQTVATREGALACEDSASLPPWEVSSDAFASSAMDNSLRQWLRHVLIPVGALRFSILFPLSLFFLTVLSRLSLVQPTWKALSWHWSCHNKVPFPQLQNWLFW